MKPKHALVKDGFLPAGSENVRGRLSGAAIERCMELASQGWDIDGYSVTASTGPEPDKVEKVKADPNRIVDIPEPARDANSWDAFTSEGAVGIKTVCNVCRNSLTYCYCQFPKVWVDHEREAVVSFKSRG